MKGVASRWPGLLVLAATSWAPAAAAQDDVARRLAAVLDVNEPDEAAAAAAVTAAVEAGAVDALPVLLEAIDDVCESLSKSEVDAARATIEIDQKTASGADAKLVEDGRAELEKAQRSASRGLAVLESVVRGVPALLDAAGRQARPGSVAPLLAAYEGESRRVEAHERKQEQQQGRLAQLTARNFELEGDLKSASGDAEKKDLEKKLQEVQADRAEARARVDRTGVLLDAHRAARSKLIDVTGALLRTVKGGEVDAALKKIEKHVDGRAPADERVRWVDLYARIGRETIPGELASVAADSGKAVRKAEPELVKLRENCERARELYFKEVEQRNDGKVSVGNKNAFEQSTQELMDATARQLALERLRDATARAVGPAIATLPAEKRSKPVATLLAAAKGEKDVEVRCGLLESCGALDEPAVREALRKLLVEDKEVKARLAALEALVALRDGEAMEIVRVRLLAHENWRVRVAAAAALARVPQKESVPALIAALEVESGRVREDVTDALQRLTGQSFAMSAPVWKQWWEQNQATFDPAQVPPQRKSAVAAWDEAAKGKVTFYGISSVSKKVCFVLDVSRSMEDPADRATRGDKRKIDVAKEQLKQAIGGLSDGDQVMIVTFAGTAARWQPKMATVSAGTRQKMIGWIDEKLELGPGTNIHAGMKEALTVAGLGARDAAYDSAIDTIFFLSDGDATVGEVVDPIELRRLIREWNRLSRIRIHTIGVGDEPNIALLYGIAEDSGGQFQKR